MEIYIAEIVIIYILGILFLYILKNKKLFILFSFGLMSFILGARASSVGEDTQHFIDIFHISKKFSIIDIILNGTESVYENGINYQLKIENGYFLLNKFVSIFTSNEQYLLFIVSILTCFLFAKFIMDNIEHVFIATQIFLCESIYMNSFNLMRQMLALSIGIQCYTFLKKNKCIKSFFVILLSMMFHKTAIILFIFYILFFIKDSKKLIRYIFYGICFLIVFFQYFVDIFCLFFPKYINYFYNNYYNLSINGQLILYIFEISLCFLVYFRGIKYKEIGIQTASIILYLFFEILGFKIVAFSRVALYFRSFLILFFPSFLNYLKKNAHIFYLFIMLLLITLLFLSYARSDARMYQIFWNA